MYDTTGPFRGNNPGESLDRSTKLLLFREELTDRGVDIAALDVMDDDTLRLVYHDRPADGAGRRISIIAGAYFGLPNGGPWSPPKLTGFIWDRPAGRAWRWYVRAEWAPDDTQEAINTYDPEDWEARLAPINKTIEGPFPYSGPRD